MVVKSTEKLKVLLTTYGVKLDVYHEEIISKLNQQWEGIQANQQAIQESQVGIQANQRMLENLLQLATAAQTKQDSSGQISVKDKASRKSLAWNKAKQYFAVKADPIAKFKDLQRSFVPGTDHLLTENPGFKAWIDKDESFLWLTGEEGTGKSHLAYLTIRILQ